MSIEKIFAKYDAPWDVYELNAQSRGLRESGRYCGVTDKNELRIASHIPMETAVLIAIAPEMLVLVECIAEDDKSDYQSQAKLLLDMIKPENLKRTAITEEIQS